MKQATRDKVRRGALMATFVAMGLMATVAMGDTKAIPFANDDTIDQIQEKIKLNGYQFKVKPNWVFNLSKEERQKMRVKRAPTALQRKAANGRFTALKSLKRAPTSFDWRDYNGHSYIGAVLDQGALGSCYAFGACASAEGVYNVATGNYDANCADFSESYIVWSLGSISPYSAHFGGAGGADYDYYELLALTEEGTTGKEGVCSEADFPYQTTQPSAAVIAASWDYPRTLFQAWHRVYPASKDDTTAQIKQAIIAYGVVDAAVKTTSAFDTYSSGVYQDTYTTTTEEPYYYAESDHAISLVGWDDNPPEGGGGCWILRNSWGSDWGEDGYMRIRYFSAGVNFAVAYVVYEHGLPTVTTTAATSVGASGATLNGTVNPNGSATTYYFEYGTTMDYGNVTTTASAGSGATAVAVNAAITGLQSSTTYHFRLVATNSNGTGYGGDLTFATSGEPRVPDVTTGTADSITETGATLHGQVNPRGAATEYYFEYGETTAYGSQSTPATLPSGTTDVAVNAAIGGLGSVDTYHYRLVGKNNAGTTYGADRTFTLADVLFEETFENGGAIPTGWTQEAMTGEQLWKFMDGGLGSVPSTAYAGDYNACFYYEDSAAGKVTRLITPAIDLSSVSSATLTFWLCQAAWEGDQDTLKVYYRRSASDAWTALPGADFTKAVTDWTQQTFALPSLSSTYYLAFEGAGNWGHGVCLDNVVIAAATPGTYAISGLVSGDITAGVTMTLSGDASATTTTGADGAYTFTGLSAGSYVVTPSLSGYTFSPTSRAVTIASADVTGVNFTASTGPVTYTVTFVAGDNGSLTGDTSQTVESGADCSAVTAVPDDGYYFDGWTGDYTGTANPLIVTGVTKNMTITANFTATAVYHVAPGSVFTVTVETALTKVPKVTINTGTKAKVLTTSKEFKPGLTAFECQWTSAKDVPGAYTLSVNGAPLTSSFNIEEPTLTEMTPTSGEADTLVTVTGAFFGGMRCPKIYMLYDDPKSGKTKKVNCKIQKPYVYPDVKDRDGKSVMDLTAGESEVSFYVPRKIDADTTATVVIEFNFTDTTIEIPFN